MIDRDLNTAPSLEEMAAGLADTTNGRGDGVIPLQTAVVAAREASTGKTCAGLEQVPETGRTAVKAIR